MNCVLVFSSSSLSLLLIFLPDIWREIARSNVMDHAHLCGTLHLRGGQWLPLHVVAVSLSSPIPPDGPSFLLIPASVVAVLFLINARFHADTICARICRNTRRSRVSRVQMRGSTGIYYISSVNAHLWIGFQTVLGGSNQ